MKKRSVISSLIAMTVLIVSITACGSKNTKDIVSEVPSLDVSSGSEESSYDTHNEEDIPHEDADLVEKVAVVDGPYGSIQLSIPGTWEFEICDVDDKKLMSCAYGIHLKPVVESKGCIEVGYSENFGVCGTGLETKNISVANSEAHIGYYDGNTNWSFLTWTEPDSELKNITVLCDADWGSKYLDELLEILDSIWFDKENQTGGIGEYQVSSELGINEGNLYVSARNVTSTGCALVLNYTKYGKNEADTKADLYYSSYLPISKRVGEDWVKLEYKPDNTPAFEDIAYIIKENEETIYEYNWERLYVFVAKCNYQ